MVHTINRALANHAVEDASLVEVHLIYKNCRPMFENLSAIVSLSGDACDLSSVKKELEDLSEKDEEHLTVEYLIWILYQSLSSFVLLFSLCIVFK